MGGTNRQSVTRNVISRCPIEMGVAQTANYGTISPGIIIASIAAGLQPQNVEIRDFLSHDLMKEFNNENVESMQMRIESSEAATNERANLVNSLKTIDNHYAASISGDIAEVCVFQGPIRGVNTSVGLSGRWNDTLYPRVHILPTTHQQLWEMTDAEILVSLDALFITKNIQSWVDRISRLRVSQIFDMYYSSRGIPIANIENLHRKKFYTGRPRRPVNEYQESPEKSERMRINDNDLESNVQYDGISKACHRHKILESIDIVKLKDETFNFAQILQIETPTTIVTDEVLRRNCDSAVDRFIDNASKLAYFKINMIADYI